MPIPIQTETQTNVTPRYEEMNRPRRYYVPTEREDIWRVRAAIASVVNRILKKWIQDWLIKADVSFSSKDLLKNMSDAELLKHVQMCQWVVNAGWDIILSEMNGARDLWRKLRNRYTAPQLEIYEDTAQTWCGWASSKMWPFYCPVDETVWLDLGFYRNFNRDFSKQADDFLPLFVQWHEKVHHVQKKFWIIDFADRLKARYPKKANKIQQLIELQADYLLWVCIHHINKKKKIIEANDIIQAMEIAMSIGDDTLQSKNRIHAPHAFTHGSSAQRTLTFLAWFESGDWEYWLSILNEKVITEQIIRGNDDEPIELFRAGGEWANTKVS